MAGSFQADFSVRDLEPILNEFYLRGRGGQEKMYWSEIYGAPQGSVKQKETISNFSALPGLIGFNSGQLIPGMLLKDAFTTTFTHRLFGGVVGIAQETFDDSQYKIPQKAGMMLGRSDRLCVERVAHEPINLGFSANLADGVPLFSAAHPSVNGGPLGNNISVAADPSFTALDNHMAVLNFMTDDAGNPIVFRDIPKLWIVHPIFEGAALQAANSISTAFVVGSGVGNANSGLVNPYKGQGMGAVKVMADPFIDDNDSSYLLALGAHEGRVFSREDAALNTWKENNPRAIFSSKIRRLSSGFTDYRGISGNTGA